MSSRRRSTASLWIRRRPFAPGQTASTRYPSRASQVGVSFDGLSDSRSRVGPDRSEHAGIKPTPELAEVRLIDDGIVVRVQVCDVERVPQAGVERRAELTQVLLV